MPKLRVRLFPLVLMVFALMIIGMLFYSLVEEWSYIDSLYFTVMTLTTVGYGDLVPSSAASKIFTIFYVLVGVYMLFYAIRIIAGYYVDKKTPNIHRAVTQTLEHMVHKHKHKGDMVLKVKEDAKGRG